MNAVEIRRYRTQEDDMGKVHQTRDLYIAVSSRPGTYDLPVFGRVRVVPEVNEITLRGKGLEIRIPVDGTEVPPVDINERNRLVFNLADKPKRDFIE